MFVPCAVTAPTVCCHRTHHDPHCASATPLCVSIDSPTAVSGKRQADVPLVVLALCHVADWEAAVVLRKVVDAH
jgi:hypothetical protein